ncbi:hypothetical protein MMC17_005963 [Xylographa soralifera]|nr:hypothetical protein [Xylographa soralifera]
MATAKAMESTMYIIFATAHVDFELIRISTAHVVSNNTFGKVSSNNKRRSEEMLPWDSPSIPKAWQPKSTRKASTTHGDLSNLRPKSPPLMVFMTPNSGIRHVPRNDHFDKASDLPVIPKSPSVKPRLQRCRKDLAKTPTYDLKADLLSCRTRSQRENKSSVSGSPPPTRTILIGLDCAYESPIALYKPRIQLPELQFPLLTGNPHGLSSLRHCLPIEQLDNCTVWTQLSFETAEMLYEIDRLITSCAEDLLADKLTDLDMASSKQASTVCTTNRGTSRNLYLLSFSVNELVEIFFERMRLDYYHHMSTYSPERLKELFLLYLLSRNNIDKKAADGRTYGTMTLGLEPSGGLHAPHPRADVIQRSDTLLFPCLDILPREGSVIEIRPRYHQGVFDERNDNSYSDVTYSIADLPPWLHWDEQISGWTGRIPMYSELRGMSTTGRQIIDGGRDGPYAVLHLLRLEVKGTLIVRHSSLSVCLKRTVRTRLTLKVIPWYAAKRAQTPLSPWQHESYSQNDSAAVDSKFQEYLTKRQKALEPRSGECRVDQNNGSRIIDKIDSNFIIRQDVHNPWDSTTKLGDGPPRNVHSDHRKDELFLHHPDHVHPFMVDEDSEPQRISKFQGSSEAGSAYELQEYPASDLRFSFRHLLGSPIQPHRRKGCRWHHCKPSCSETGQKSSGNENGHTSDLHREHPVSDEGHSNNELDDHYYSEDNHEYETDIFTLHERDGQDDTLQYASPELYKMAQVLHQAEFQSNGAQRLNFTQDEHYTPSEVSGYSKRSTAASTNSENKQDGRENVLLSETDEETEDMKSQSLSPTLTPYITCLIDRFAPLRDLRVDSSSSGSTSSSLLSGHEAVETSFVEPYAAGMYEEVSDEDAETVRLDDYPRFDSGCYMADNEAENDDNIDITDSVSQRGPGTKAKDAIPPRFGRLVELMSESPRSSSGSSTSSDAPTQQILSPRETPKLGPMSRQFSPTELLPCPALSLEPSPPYLKQSHSDTGLWQMESFDELAANPSVRQEQALLWRVLADKENIDAAPKKDPKLEAEELKGLWEVLKYEARQKQRNGVSEETLGVESGEEYATSESEEEKGTSSSEGGDGEMEDTWNFGC